MASFNPVTVYSNACFFNCTTVGWDPDYDVADLKSLVGRLMLNVLPFIRPSVIQLMFSLV